MRELDLQEFPDELCHVKFNFSEACEQVGSQILDKEKAKHKIIEDKIEWPYFALLMWDHIFKYQKILTHKEFKSKYSSINYDFIAKQNLTPYGKKCLEGRIYRSYGTIVRDCLFSLQLKEELFEFGVEVRFNRILDTEEGIDVLLLYNENRYGLNLYLDSENAEKYREKKTSYRHEKYDDVICCNLPCPIGGRWKNGDIWMYGITDRNIIRKELGLPIIEACYSVIDSFTSWEDFSN